LIVIAAPAIVSPSQIELEAPHVSSIFLRGRGPRHALQVRPPHLDFNLDAQASGRYSPALLPVVVFFI